MKKKYNILIDAAGTATALSILKGLNKQKAFNIKKILIDHNDFVSGKYLSDKFYQVPFSSDPKFSDSILEICEKEKIDIFIPIIDRSFPVLARKKQAFDENNTFLLLPGLQNILTCVDKFKTYQFLKKNNIPTPETYLSYKNIKFDKPLIIKIRKYGIGSQNVFKLDDKNEMLFYTKNRKNYILQEYIDGREFTADCLSNLDGSHFITAVIRERLEIKNGLAVKIKFVEKKLASEILVFIKKISELLNLPGAYNIQGFITNKNIYFTEINPRFAGGHAFTIEAGLNSIEYIIEMINGVSPEEIKKRIKINENLKMIRYWNEIFIDNNKSWINQALS